MPIFSNTALSLFPRILPTHLAKQSSSIIPLQLLGSLRSPFFGNRHSFALIHSTGTVSDSQNTHKISNNTFAPSSELNQITLYTSMGRPLRPAALPLCIALRADSASFKVGGSSSSAIRSPCGRLSSTLGSYRRLLACTLYSVVK